MLYNPQLKRFEVWEKGDNTLLIMGTAKRGKEAEKLYEQTYRTTADTVYDCTESFENAKGEDNWSSEFSENRGNGFGNSAKAESEGFQGNARGSGSNLLGGNSEKSININEPSSTDGGFSMPNERKSTKVDNENRILELDSQISDIEEELDLADFNDLSNEKIQRPFQ